MRIAILDGGVLNPGDVDWGPISSLGETTIYDTTAPDQVVARAQGQDVVIVNKVVLDSGIVSQLPDVKLVAVLATGYNNIDLAALAQRGVPVCNVVAYGVQDVAQHAMSLLLELSRNIRLHSDSVKSGEWHETWCYWKKSPLCLAGLTLGVVGFGAIGRCMADLGHAFGMDVIVYNRSRKNAPDWQPFAFVELPELLARSHAISLHCPLNEQSRHLFNAQAFAAMRKGAILINTARGPLVDETACAEALRSGQLGGLGTDVLEQEPPAADNPLFTAPNTLITPHIAWATTRARQNIIDLTAKNIQAWQAGQPTNVVN